MIHSHSAHKNSFERLPHSLPNFLIPFHWFAFTAVWWFISFYFITHSIWSCVRVYVCVELGIEKPQSFVGKTVISSTMAFQSPFGSGRERLSGATGSAGHLVDRGKWPLLINIELILTLVHKKCVGICYERDCSVTAGTAFL